MLDRLASDVGASPEVSIVGGLIEDHHEAGDLPVTHTEVELATITHDGSHSEIDRSYGALASYVARHALAVDGPIREYYPVSSQDTADDRAWRTDIGWPVFRTAVAE